MSNTAAELTQKHCRPCDKSVSPLSADQLKHYLEGVPDWRVSSDNKRIRREWKVKDFLTGLDFLNRVGRIAEEQDHHPDVHLTGYRKVAIELYTHAIGGLSENDFIVAAKIDQLPVELKT